MTIDHTRTPKQKRGTLPAFTPVPRQKERSNGLTPEIQQAFIEALADTGSVKSACRAVNRSDTCFYLLRRHPEAQQFRKAWEAALALGVQRIEDVAMDRALNGVEVPVYSYGKLVGTRMSYNDRLLMFMLRNRAPKRFTEGRARGLNALDGAKLKKLKAQWRKEWDAEKEAARPSAAAVKATIDGKVEAVRKRIMWNTSPHAVELQQIAAAQRSADEAAGWRPGSPYKPYAEAAARLLPQFVEETKAQWPDPEPFDAEEWAKGVQEDEDDWEERAALPARPPSEGAPDLAQNGAEPDNEPEPPKRPVPRIIRI